jgi:hypothetical protein
MDRRALLKLIGGLPLTKPALAGLSASAAAPSPTSRVRPGDPRWPGEATWQELARRLAGDLIKVESPLSACVGAPADACAKVKNPCYLGDTVALTQTLGWPVLRASRRRQRGLERRRLHRRA